MARCKVWGRWSVESLLGLLLLLPVVVLVPAGIVQAQETDNSAEKKATTLTLTLDFDDGSQKRFTGIAFVEGMTVFDVLEKASKHPRGFPVQTAGKGETLMVKAIDRVENEGAGSNWIFEVNGKLGTKSCAITKLKGGDSVLWRFGKYE